MRKMMIALTAASGATMMAAAPAGAQYYERGYGYEQPRYDRGYHYGYQQDRQRAQRMIGRVNEIKQDIRYFSRRGLLSNKEYRKFTNRAHKLQRKIWKRTHRGLSRGEIRDLREDIRDLRQDVREEAREGRRWNRDRYDRRYDRRGREYDRRHDRWHDRNDH